MSGIASRLAGSSRQWAGSLRRRPGAPGAPIGPAVPLAPPRVQAKVDAPPFQRALSMTLGIVSATIIALIVALVVVSPIQHYAGQKNLYNQLRLSLAEGSTPVGPLDVKGNPVVLGTPVAVMTAPVIGIGREVVVEGSAGSQTMQGIGHQRNTSLPCQVGTSVLMARSGSYGAVGAAWAALRTGQEFTMQMGEGSCTYQVLDQRHPGQISPPPPTGREGRLILTTAAGLPYMPTEVLRVDAKLVTDAFDRPAQLTAAIPPSEAAMGTDPTNAFALVLLLELLVAAVLAATWLWRRWGRWQTWIVSAPVIGVVFLLCATCVNQIVLPNLL